MESLQPSGLLNFLHPPHVSQGNVVKHQPLCAIREGDPHTELVGIISLALDGDARNHAGIDRALHGHSSSS